MLVGTMTTGVGVVTVLPLSYTPAEIFFIAATAPQGIRINVLGEGVVMDLDAAGLLAMSNLRGVNRVTNAYKIPIANGLFKNRSCEITFTNGVAAAIPFYAFSEQLEGSVYIQTIRQALLANSGERFQDFAVLALPSLGANDTIDITYADGLTQRFTRDEILALNMAQQNNIASYVIDNLEGKISQVQVVPAAAQTAYIMRYADPKGVSAKP